MLGALKNLVTIVQSIVGFITTFITSLIGLIADLPMYVTMLFQFLRFIPTYFITFATIFITGSVLMFILGRNKGGS